MVDKPKKINFFTLYFLLFISLSKQSFAWGARAHEIIIENLSIKDSDLKNCELTKAELLKHINDPDTSWKKKLGFKNEPRFHFLHLDKLEKNWEQNLTLIPLEKGGLIPRIITWHDKAKSELKEKKFESLKTTMIGLAHYLSDLTQPLHLHSDYDGKNHGLPDLHSQFETKIIKKNLNEIKNSFKAKDSTKIEMWKKLKFESIIITVAKQSNALAEEVFKNSTSSFNYPIVKSKKSKQKAFNQKKHWDSKSLWLHNKELILKQLRLASDLIDFTFSELCIGNSTKTSR